MKKLAIAAVLVLAACGTKNDNATPAGNESTTEGVKKRGSAGRPASRR